jgi:diguanylate cyclase (GGDEF)-like protein
MTAAGGIRANAARRLSGGAAAATMPLPADSPHPGRTARIGTFVLLLMAVAMVACAGTGLIITRHNDSRQEAQRHAALENALDEFHAVFGDLDHFDAGQLQLIERRAGVADLHFDVDITPGAGREVQSLLGTDGRIIGWFSWVPDRALIGAMEWLWGLVLAGGVILAAGAALALRSTARLDSVLSRQAAKIRDLTTRDTVTGLPNRSAMLVRLNEAIASRGAHAVAFALIDIDGFRDINETAGRAGGDAVLAEIARRLQAALPEGAIAGRFDDDEFAVIVAKADPQTEGFGAAMAAALAAPIVMDQAWQVTAGIGIAQAPGDGTTADELHRRAAFALRAAKDEGRGTVRRFVPEIQEEHAERRFVRRELESAIKQKAFDVHYQPVVAAEGGAVVGVEALLRWNHPARGAIAPALFIPLAEESGQMVELGELVLRRALADGARWPDLFVAVNLSPVQMRSGGLVDLVAAALADTGMAAGRVVLEITEGILIDNPEETEATLNALRALGVTIALDDFGTGYSSLNYLQKFPFDRLKIDRAFVAALGTTGNTGAIIQSIVTLGHALGMKVLAEGVETNEQRVLLRLAGCDEMQGFLFAKACPAEAINKLLARPGPARIAGRRSGA